MENQILAQINNPLITGNLATANGTMFLSRFVPALITFGIVIGIVIFFIQLILGAVAWISSGGDKGQLETAKSKITNALIGLVILLSIFAIVQLVQRFFGINIMSFNIGELNITPGTYTGGSGGSGGMCTCANGMVVPCDAIGHLCN